MLALNFPLSCWKEKRQYLRDAWSQKVAFYDMFFPLVFLLLKPNPFALCRESFASLGRWERCRREGDCSVLAQHWMFREREWTVSFSLSSSLFLCLHHYGVEARKPHSQWKHAWAQGAKTKGTLSITHYIILWTCTSITVMSVRERLSGTRYQGDCNDEMH